MAYSSAQTETIAFAKTYVDTLYWRLVFQVPLFLPVTTSAFFF